MKKFFVCIYMAVVTLFCTSCVIEVEYENIPFQVNDVYYSLMQNDKPVKNVYYTQSSFEKDFKAAISDLESMKKIVDFEKNFVVTITDVASDIMKNIEVTEILKKDMGLHVKYRIKEEGEIGFLMCACTVVSISREYMDCEIAFHDITDWE